MSVERIERAIMSRVNEVGGPGLASTQVIRLERFALPSDTQGEGTLAVVVLGAGRLVPGHQVETAHRPSMQAAVYERIAIVIAFVIAAPSSDGRLHVYLEEPAIRAFAAGKEPRTTP